MKLNKYGLIHLSLVIGLFSSAASAEDLSDLSEALSAKWKACGNTLASITGEGFLNRTLRLGLNPLTLKLKEVLHLGEYGREDLTNLLYPDRKFDLVTSVSVIDQLAEQKNFEKLNQAMAEIIRVMKKDGEVRIAYRSPGNALLIEKALNKNLPLRQFETRISSVRHIFGDSSTGVISIKLLD